MSHAKGELTMAQRKPVIIDGCITDVPYKATLAEVLPREVHSVQTHDGKLVRREDFARVPVPEGFETNLSPINKGGVDSPDSPTRRRVLLAAVAAMMTSATAPQAEARALASAAAAAARRRAAAGKMQKAARPTQPEGKPRDIQVSRSRHPAAAEHIDHAQRKGQPSVLHIDRAGAEARRRASTGSVHRETRPSPRHDRDEYPPAFTREGGANANVRFIPRRDNRGSGSSMSHQIRDLPDGQKVRIVVAD